MNFFSGWDDIGRVALIGTLAYLALVILLRGYGKRTLSKLNAFDFIVTVALGSILATVMLNASVSLAQGLAALVVLMSWQFAFTWLSSRFGWIRELVASEPRLIAHDGEFIASAMRTERIAEEEVMQAIRKQGFEKLEQVRSVVLEPDGTLSVVGS